MKALLHLKKNHDYDLSHSNIPYSPALAGMPEKIEVHQHAGKTRIYRHAGKYEVLLLEDGRRIYFDFSNNIFHFLRKKNQ